MMTTRTMDLTETNDSDLVAKSLGGSREAFRQIVERYQTLICSLAYCATGNVSQSQDMAQETFIAAWKDLPALREPEKLRAWLCRIARNRISKNYRRAGSDPVANAELLEDFHEVPAIEAQPSEQAITREEEAILWRSLEKIPEAYREPLILFYRESQSIEHVAAALELSEDAVKQRLSRGRKLLQEEVQAFVEKTLVRTVPGREFSGAVLAALPLTTGSMATASASMGAKGAATAKTGFLAVWFTLLAPFIGIFAGFLTQLWEIRATTIAGHDRRIKTVKLIAFWILVPGMAVAGEVSVYALRQRFAWNDRAFFVARTSFWWLYALMLATWMVGKYHQIMARCQGAASGGSLPAAGARPASLPTTVMSSVGMHLAMFLWFVAFAWKAGDQQTAIIVTLVIIALATGQFFFNRGRVGVSAVRANFGYTALCVALIVGVINLRLDAWLAIGRGVTLAEIHQLYPLWMVPLLSAAMVFYIVLLLVLPRRRQPARVV